MSLNAVMRAAARRIPPTISRAPCASPKLFARPATLGSSATLRGASVLRNIPQRSWSSNPSLLRAFSTTSVRLSDDPSSKPPTPSKADLIKHEQVFNLPNILTFSRLLSAPLIGYLILNSHPVAALSLFALSAVTDVLDGWIARTYKLQTVVGSVIDPMADKTLMTILTVTLAMKGGLPVWLAGIILGRDVGLAISALWWRWVSLPPPKTMGRYWDFSLPSAEVRPTAISKINTALQLGLIGWCMVNPMITMTPELEFAFQMTQYLVATTTVWSGLSYVFSKDAVKIVKHGQEVAEAAKEAGKLKK